MANTQALCNSFKSEVMTAIHALGTTVARGGTTKDTVKAAFYYASATVNYDTTAYSATGEVATSGDYSAGGATVTNANAPANGSGASGKAYWTPSASIAFTGVTWVAFDALLLYNSTQSNKGIGVFTFGSQTVTAGNVTLSMPTNDATTGLIRLA